MGYQFTSLSIMGSHPVMYLIAKDLILLSFGVILFHFVFDILKFSSISIFIAFRFISIIFLFSFLPSCFLFICSIKLLTIKLLSCALHIFFIIIGIILLL